ncbi:MAG: hypothetical protein R2827_09730 [Bdellovibrionales bacterium]
MPLLGRKPSSGDLNILFWRKSARGINKVIVSSLQKGALVERVNIIHQVGQLDFVEIDKIYQELNG